MPNFKPVKIVMPQMKRPAGPSTQVMLTKHQADGTVVKSGQEPTSRGDATFIVLATKAEVVKLEQPLCLACNGARGHMKVVDFTGRLQWVSCGYCQKKA